MDDEKNISILLVDDEEQITSAMKKYFEILGYETDEASNGVDAFEKIKLKKYDFVFTDLKMPQGDGITLIKELKKNKIDTKVFVISAFLDLDYEKNELMKFGATAVLQKPVNFSVIEELIKRNT